MHYNNWKSIWLKDFVREWMPVLWNRVWRPCKFWLNKIITNWSFFISKFSDWALLMFDEKMRMCNSLSSDYSPGNMRDFLNYNKLMAVYSSSLDIVFRLNFLPPPLSSTNWQGQNFSRALLKWSYSQSIFMTDVILPDDIMILHLRPCLWSQQVIILSGIILIYVRHDMTWWIL